MTRCCPLSQVGRWGSVPVLVFKDKQSYGQNKTKEYDEQATRYLSYLLFPLVGGYAVWSLVYQTHKSWYSWVVTSLTGAVYTFGEPLPAKRPDSWGWLFAPAMRFWDTLCTFANDPRRLCSTSLSTRGSHACERV